MSKSKDNRAHKRQAAVVPRTLNSIDERIAALVYFTDLYTPDLDELHAPEYPVIWAVHSNSDATVPFGDITDVVFN